MKYLILLQFILVSSLSFSQSIKIITNSNDTLITHKLEESNDNTALIHQKQFILIIPTDSIKSILKKDIPLNIKFSNIKFNTYNDAISESATLGILGSSLIPLIIIPLTTNNISYTGRLTLISMVTISSSALITSAFAMMVKQANKKPLKYYYN